MQQARAMDIFSSSETYSPQEILADLQAGIFAELDNSRAISQNRRNLQKYYVINLLALYQDGLSTDFDFTSATRTAGLKLQLKIANALVTTRDTVTKSHLQDLQEKLHNAFTKPFIIAKQGLTPIN